jgi:hypothetical protein
MPADPIDLCTVDEVKRARRDSATGLDTLIQDAITQASSMMVEYAERQITPLDANPLERVFVARDWGRKLWIDDLSAPPASITVNDPDGVFARTIPAAQVIFLPRNREAWRPINRLELRPSAGWFAPGEEISILGRWGFPAIPGFVRRACVEAVIEWLRLGAPMTLQSPDQFEPGTPPARALPLSTRTALGRLKPPILA